MAPTDLHTSESIPLSRLLKRREVETLLAEFQELLPDLALALVGSDGQLFAGNGPWSPSELAEAVRHVSSGQPTRQPDRVIYPLRAQTHLVGALIARRVESAASHAAALRALHRSLSMLLDQSAEKRAVAAETLERYREINLLYSVSETIGARLDPMEIPPLVLSEAGRVIRSDAAAVLLPAPDHNGDVHIQAMSGEPWHVEALAEVGRDAIERAMHDGRPSIVTDLPPGPLPLGAILCAPLNTQAGVIGVVLLGRRPDAPMFTAGDEKLLMALAGQAAIAIEKARLHLEEIQRQRLEEELAVGKRIQLSLLPERCPDVPGWDFAAVYQAARQVGGDLYDFFDLPGEPRRLGMVIADVTGKGVAAALFMAVCRTVMRLQAISSAGPADALAQANRFMMQELRSGLFLSAFYATLDVQSGAMAYASGGHERPLWLSARSGECRELVARGIILGAFERVDIAEEHIHIAPGDVVLFYTDGVTEARDAQGDLFGIERLQATLTACRDRTAAQVTRAVVDAVESFAGDVPQSDDLTLFVVRRHVDGSA